VTETYWGYEIQDNLDRFDRDRLAEPLLRFLGLVTVLSAYGQWFLPAAFFGGDTVFAKALLCFFLGSLGCWVYWMAGRGMLTSVEIDTTRREIRVVRRNSKGRRHVGSVVPMRRVESAFVQRTKDVGQRPNLYVRMRDGRELLHIANGPEAELETILARLHRDLRSPRERVEQKLADSLGFRSVRRP
jgi:hypothetical protein